MPVSEHVMRPLLSVLGVLTGSLVIAQAPRPDEFEVATVKAVSLVPAQSISINLGTVRHRPL